jgi:hypothetical protein
VDLREIFFMLLVRNHVPRMLELDNLNTRDGLLIAADIVIRVVRRIVQPIAIVCVELSPRPRKL